MRWLRNTCLMGGNDNAIEMGTPLSLDAELWHKLYT